MRSHEIVFSGDVLRRGFWVYVIEVTAPMRRVFYIGRTGDSSSPNASSPFNRIGNHLDFRATAKGNALARQLAAEEIRPEECAFRMISVGPIFPEAVNFVEHAAPRNKLAALERDIAAHFRERGLIVIGSHGSKYQPVPELLAEVMSELEQRIPSLRAA